MYPIRLKIIISGSVFALAAAAYGWVTGVDPSAASFPLVGRNQTVGYTGELNWSETVMTVPGRNGLDVNLVLTYSGNIGVDQEASWVGLGFDLGVGYITRQMVNMPDEVEPENPNDPSSTDMGAFYWGRECHQWGDPKSGEEEGDNFIRPQDKFYMVLPGGGCELMASGYDELLIGGGSHNNYDNIKFHPVNWRAWKVDPEFGYWGQQNRHYISAFTVTTEDGTVYKFDKHVWSQLSTGQNDMGYDLSQHPYGYLYENPVWMQEGPGWGDNYNDFPPAPYIWYLTEILSPDYVDSDGQPGPSNGDKGSWIEITYDVFTGNDPTNTGEGYVYWTRYESYYRIINEQHYCTDYLRQNRTRLHLAVINEVKTPTHVAEFHTSYRSGADAVAYYDSTVTGHRHPKQLDKVVLKSKYGDNERVSEVRFTYDESLAIDEHPVTDGWESYVGGRLTLKEVQLYGKDGETKLPPYRFEYYNESFYRPCYACQPDERDPWGVGRWHLKMVKFPTGGEMEVGYDEQGFVHWIQDYTELDPAGEGPRRVTWIEYRTKFDPGQADTRMDFRRVEYWYGMGVAINDPAGGPHRYKTSAGLYSLSNYVGYDFVRAQTEQKFADPGQEGCPTWWDTIRNVKTDYVTAKEKPDEPGDLEPIDRFTSNEWKRGVPEEVCVIGGDSVVYNYGEHEMWTFNGTYGDGNDEAGEYKIVSGWKRLKSEIATADGVSKRTAYCHDPPVGPDTIECENCNGLPRQIEVYRDIGGELDPGEAGKNSAAGAAAELAAAAGEFVGETLVGVVKGKAEVGEAAAGVGREGSRVAGNLWDDFRDNLDGWEKVRTTFITYAYDQTGDPYSSMVYGQKHMMSQKYRVGVRDHDGGRLSASEIHYHDFDWGDPIRIYPKKSWVWLDDDGDKLITEDEKIMSTYDTYDVYGNLKEVIDPKGRHSKTEYSSTYNNSLPTRFENALGHVTTVEYDDVQSTVVKVTDPNNLVTEYKYDNLGRLLAVWYPNRPRIPNENAPSVKYRYNWAQFGEIDLTRPWKGINWVRTAKLIEDPGQTRYEWTTSFYNGLGEIFRTIKHYNAPLLDEQTQEPVEGYWRGMYYDVETNTLGVTSRRFVPYEADEWRIDGVQPGKTYSIRVPFPLNNCFYGPDEEYRPFWETVYVLDSLRGPRISEVYGPATYYIVQSGSYINRTVRRTRYGSEPNDMYSYSDDACLRYVEGYDECGRAAKKYYDSLGRHVLTLEGGQYDILAPFNDECDWGDPIHEYITTTTFIYDDLDRLDKNIAANSQGPEPFETTYAYDTLSRMTSVDDPDRGLLTYGYDDVGNLVAFQDPELYGQYQYIGYTYDNLNRVLSEGVYEGGMPGGDADDGGITFSAGVDVFGGRVPVYDNSRDNADAKRPQGKDLSRSVVGKKIIGLFDDLDVDVKITYHYDEYPAGDAGGGLDEYPTDYPVGKLTWTEDLIGKKSFYYDNMGRTVATVSDRCYFDNDVFAHEYNYNIGGQLTSEKYPSGTRIYYEYDAIGRLIIIPGLYGNGAIPPPGPGDSNDVNKGPAPATPGEDVPSRILPSLKARRLSIDRNPDAKLDYFMAGVNPFLDEGITRGFEYDERGRLEHIRPNNARQTIITYDPYEHQLISEIRFDMAENYFDDIVYWYSYEGNRNVAQIIDSLPGTEHNRKRTFEYDTLNRLIWYEVGWQTDGMDAGKTIMAGIKGGVGRVGPALDGADWGGSSPYSPPYQFYCVGGVHYAYDEVGNRQYEERNDVKYYYTYEDNKNSLASDPWGNTYTYNANGALATKYNIPNGATYDYTYDYAGRLVKIQKQGGDAAGSDRDAAPDVAAPDTPSAGTPYGADGPLPRSASTASNPARDAPSAYDGPDEAADSPLDYLNPGAGPFVSGDEEWEFTYDGAGAKIYKVSDVSASKYILDAGGRTVMEFSNDVRKSSANVVMNPSFEIYSQEEWVEPAGDGGDAGEIDAALSEAAAGVESAVTAAAGSKAEVDDVTVGDFGYWTEYTGEATAGEICCEPTDPLDGKLAVKMWRPAACNDDFRLMQVIPIKHDPPRTYEVRFFAKTSADFSGRAFVHLTIKDSEWEPADAGLDLEGFDVLDTPQETLDSINITGEEWREYRMVFASCQPGLSVQLVLDKDASGAVYFDRFSVAEYQNDLENASFEEEALSIPVDFYDWEEEVAGGEILVGEGILTEKSAIVARTVGGAGVPPTEVWQSKPVFGGRTYEVTAAVKTESLTNAQAFIIAEMESGGWGPYYIAVPPAGTSGWGRYTGHYVAPANGWVKVRLGVEGEGTGVAYFEDVGMKEVPDVCENNDFEDWHIVGSMDETIGFTAWTSEANGGDVGVDDLSPHMNGAAAVLLRGGDAIKSPSLGTVKRLLGGGFDDDPIGNTILKQRINCLPRTEYEITVFVKHDVAVKSDYYGAFAVVGNIDGSCAVPGQGIKYTGDFVEVCNLDAGSSDWAAYTARFTSTQDWLEVTLGVGATCAGSATFDGILIRDLTTRRYEYIYGVGRKLATLEFEGNVPEGQLYFDHHDLLGSPVMRTDIDGDVVWKGDYAPFGETLEEQPVTWGSQYRFLGNEDDGGLMDFGARFYDPRVGRFISPDPIKDVSTANAVNPYTYCMNNPLKYTDKFGLSVAPAPYAKGGDDPSAGGGGGGIGGGGFFEGHDPIPFSAYPVYYGASWNGQAAWFHNNTVAWRDRARREMLNAARAGVNTIYINYQYEPSADAKAGFEKSLGTFTSDENIIEVTEKPSELGEGQVYLEVWGYEQCKNDVTGIGVILGEGTGARGWTTPDMTCYINFEKIAGDLTGYINSIQGSNSIDALHFTYNFGEIAGGMAAFYACHEFSHVFFGLYNVHGTTVTPFLQTWGQASPTITYGTGDIIRYVQNSAVLRKLNPAGYDDFQRKFKPP